MCGLHGRLGRTSIPQMRKKAILAVSVNTPNRSVEDFGSNEWLVEELYEKYRSDKNSVDESWWPFFEQYEKSGSGAAGTNGAGEKTSAQQEPAAKRSETKKSSSAGGRKSSAEAQTGNAEKGEKGADSGAAKKLDSHKGVTPSVNESETPKAESKSAASKQRSSGTREKAAPQEDVEDVVTCLLYTSPSPRDRG